MYQSRHWSNQSGMAAGGITPASTPSWGGKSEFSDSTGGRYFFIKKAGQLAGTYERIAEELRSQYYLTYSTTNEVWDGHWIKIQVESERPGVEVRARKGYYAVRRGGS